MELSEEEKEAIKNVRRFANILMKNKQVTIGIDNASNELIASLYKVLELLEGKNAVIETYKHTEKVLTEQIDEQQKEIEELKSKNRKLNHQNQELIIDLLDY